MNKHDNTTSNDLGKLAEDARALMAATADVAGEKVGEARERLAAALENAGDIAGRIRKEGGRGSESRGAEAKLREHPYQAIAIGVGVGLIVGFLLGSRRSGGRD